MLDDLLHHVLALAGSPWIYLLVAVALAVDAVVPVVPSETLVIALAALSVHGGPDPVALGAAVVAGSMAGDCAAYAVGRRAPDRLRSGPVGERALRALQRYGGLAILAGRFLPGGRTATTLAAGSAGLPMARFRLSVLLAGVAWAAYAIGLGRLGGQTFQDDPLIGAAVGVAFGLLTGVVFHLATRRRTPAPAYSPGFLNSTSGRPSM